jgi:anti-anti-sigma factor
MKLTADEVIIDVAAVAFVASSGLRVMLKWGHELDQRDMKLVLTNPSNTVREVLDMSGFSTILTVR